jgi:hypothetical protein
MPSRLCDGVALPKQVELPDDQLRNHAQVGQPL